MSKPKTKDYVKALTVRFTQEDYNKLNYLTTLTGISKNELVLGYIRADYDKVKGNPELQNILDKLKELNISLQNFQ